MRTYIHTKPDTLCDLQITEEMGNIKRRIDRDDLDNRVITITDVSRQELFRLRNQIDEILLGLR